jgi:hypothetical protein
MEGMQMCEVEAMAALMYSTITGLERIWNLYYGNGEYGGTVG